MTNWRRNSSILFLKGDARKQSGNQRYNIQLVKLSQLLGYADDLNLIGRSVDIVKENFMNIEKKGAEFGLKVSKKKTKYMTTSLSRNRPANHTLELNGKHFETIDCFITWGRRSAVTITSERKYVEE